MKTSAIMIVAEKKFLKFEHYKMPEVFGKMIDGDVGGSVITTISPSFKFKCAVMF